MDSEQQPQLRLAVLLELSSPQDAKREGRAVTWYESGQMESSTDYLDDQAHGWMRHGKADGSLQSECRYQTSARQGACG